MSSDRSAADYCPGMSRDEPTKTIARARAGGETALTVHCLAVGCYHQAVKTFEELKLWNMTGAMISAAS
jgi:hypothetical protein